MTDRIAIAQIITDLQSLYWVPDEAAGDRAGVAAIWLRVLGEFEPEIVRKACDEWSRFHTKRPTPAEIRKLCADAREAAEARLRLQARRQMPQEISDLWGGDMAAREAAIDAQQERYRLAGEWRQERTRAGLPIIGPTEAPKRKAPAWTAERDATRAEARQQALGLDWLDTAIDRYMENLAEAMPPPDPEPASLDDEQDSALRRKFWLGDVEEDQPIIVTRDAAE
jgi:hypothetical protein